MKADDLFRRHGDSHKQHRRRPYLAPGVERISREKARELLLRNAEPGNTTVRQMLDRIEKVLGKGAAQ
jgi:hypothetical protein